MDLQRSQIYQWICTGNHKIQTSHEQPTVTRETTTHGTELTPGIGTQTSSSKSTTSTTSSVLDKLVGIDDDVLIPNAADIDRIFHAGMEMWTQSVESAKSAFPAGFGDLSIMFKDMPALPENLPEKGILTGQPLWYVPDPEHEDTQDWGLQHIHGPQKHFTLSFPKPIECRQSSQLGTPTAPSSLSLLTLCWSYILSVRLLELQGRKAVYSRHSLQPKVTKTHKFQEGEVVLNFGASGSHELARWLCAILAPKPGWCADGGGFPPWAAFCSGDVRFVILTDEPLVLAPRDPPPCSTRATELLIELCSLYGLGHQKCSEMSSPTAAFLAALALPFYRHVQLRPQFPVLALGRRRRMDDAVLGSIRQYVTDLRYYMTLSMEPRSLGSVFWSIFWHPEIDCNLVSPWLSSILSVISPILASRDLETLARVFSFRRPRVALWWRGVFFLGDHTILDWIARYLETLEERWGFGSMAPPDTAVAAWVGSPQSFLDEEMLCVYRDRAAPVARADLLRHRYNFRLQNTSTIALSWRPFGHVARDAVEPHLWPWLDNGHVRKYVSWTWWVRKDEDIARDVQRGFRRDTGRFVADVPDHLEPIRMDQAPFAGRHDVISLAPSRDSTLRMVHYCLEEVSGDRDLDISTVYGARAHPWLRDWRGLE